MKKLYRSANPGAWSQMEVDLRTGSIDEFFDIRALDLKGVTDTREMWLDYLGSLGQQNPLLPTKLGRATRPSSSSRNILVRGSIVILQVQLFTIHRHQYV